MFTKVSQHIQACNPKEGVIDVHFIIRTITETSMDGILTA